MKQSVRINLRITAPTLRVLDESGTNLGILPLADALRLASESGQDLIEIVPRATPPVAKIIDYGKYQYLENKKLKKIKTRSQRVETKTIQIKIGTGEHDLELKASQASRFLKKGNRVKIDLFLSGRAKGFPMEFLKERLDRVMAYITEKYKIADPLKRGPRGLSLIIERTTP